jgi:hypothetical protein
VSEDTLHEVTQVAVVRHPEFGVLLMHSKERRWHFPHATLRVHEGWQDSLRRGIETLTGITDLSVRGVLRIASFSPGVVHERAQYGVFFLCSTHSSAVHLSAAHNDFRWVQWREDLAGLELFHPLVEELVAKALGSSLVC